MAGAIAGRLARAGYRVRAAWAGKNAATVQDAGLVVANFRGKGRVEELARVLHLAARARGKPRVVAVGDAPARMGVGQWVPSDLLPGAWELVPRDEPARDPGEHTMPVPFLKEDGTWSWRPKGWIRVKDMARMPSHVLAKITLSEEDSAEYLTHSEQCRREACPRCLAVRRELARAAFGKRVSAEELLRHAAAVKLPKKVRLVGREILERCPYEASFKVEIGGLPLKWVERYARWHYTDGVMERRTRTIECPGCPRCHRTRSGRRVHTVMEENVFSCRDPLKGHYRRFLDDLDGKRKVPAYEGVENGGEAGVPETEGFLGYGTGYWTGKAFRTGFTVEDENGITTRKFFRDETGTEVWAEAFEPCGLKGPERWPQDYRRPVLPNTWRKKKGMEGSALNDLTLGYSTIHTSMPAREWEQLQPVVEPGDWTPPRTIRSPVEAAERLGRILERLDVLSLNWVARWQKMGARPVENARDVVRWLRDTQAAERQCNAAEVELDEATWWLESEPEEKESAGERAVAMAREGLQQARQAIGGPKVDPGVADRAELAYEALEGLAGPVGDLVREREGLGYEVEGGEIRYEVPDEAGARVDEEDLVPVRRKWQRWAERRKGKDYRELRREAGKARRAWLKGRGTFRCPEAEKAFHEAVTYASLQFAPGASTLWVGEWKLAGLVEDRLLVEREVAA